MPIRKNPKSGIWWIDLRAPGVPRIRRSAGTTDKQAAQEYYDRLKADLWRTTKLGEEPDHTFEQLVRIGLQAGVTTAYRPEGRGFKPELVLLSLEPCHVDLAQCNAWVVAAEAKSGCALSVPLNADAIAVLRRRIAAARKYVFERQSRDGKLRKISQIDARCLKRACNAVCISDFRFHDLRHTWASWHVQRGTPLLVLKDLGGWETLEMVQQYAHLAPSHLAHHAETVTFWSKRGAETQTPLSIAE